jgi:hypothetical protein
MYTVDPAAFTPAGNVMLMEMANSAAPVLSRFTAPVMTLLSHSGEGES